jgi:methionine synthase II (cobalamin-independent)
MTHSNLNNGVHLVGNIPLSTNEEVFTTLSEALSGRLFSIPDGETGDRSNFIAWERFRFPVETIHEAIGGKPLPEGHSGVFTLDDVTPSDYDKVAKESYQRFLQLRAKGVISPKVRFQVSIPTPYECIQGHVRSEFQAQLEPFYERRISDVVESILSTIPAEDLAIQFDSCFMITALEYERGRLTSDFFKPHFSPIHEGVLERARRLCALVPSNVPLGWHLCYGDLGHKHFIEPEDLSLLVNVANDLVRCIPGDTDVSWLHMPVPKNRDDTAYFEPLKRLKAGDKTKLYLGLVHPNDEEGTFRRLQAARNVIPGRDFGVSTGCGMGRTPKEELASILQISKNVTKSGTA